MLKNIRLHIEKDEQKQAILDEKLAQHILKTQHKNVNAFQRNIPSLLAYIESSNLSSHSLFCNKYGEFNIVDYGQGRVFYGFHPEQEVALQIKHLEKNCLNVQLDCTQQNLSNQNNQNENSVDFKQLEKYNTLQNHKALPATIECLVILGCGLGIHLKQLIVNHKIKYLIVYEPQVQYFQCSALSTDWAEIFNLAKKQDTALFLQIEKDGRDIVEDIQELVDHCSLPHFHFYKHYNHPIFDSIEHELLERNWQDIRANGFTIKSQLSHAEYVPHWTSKVELTEYNSIGEKSDRFVQNLQAFKRYFPSIYEQFKNYVPKIWLPIVSKHGELNILKKDSLCTWYGESPKDECNLNFANFNSQPNKDGLVLGYSGTKLAHYIHYKFVKQTEELLKEAEDKIGELPDNVASIIMFGLGSGYQLETLLCEHVVEKLFVCEPNPDFFYASLHALDWQSIFTNIEKSNSRIYLNIGDDGTNLFRDLLGQFHSIGPYILNNTYFYQSYYNSSLNTAIAQLREQLQVVISMGEYFDHAYYGISHTKEGMRRDYPILTKNPASKLNYDDKEIPVFIVGNGPSLDSSIKSIKEWQDKAIIISCGTALQVMYKQGITPDFHAEIEQNRTTYDWASLIGDLDYLKQITLISCNGIHPDTCNLYKDVLIAFKEGESSTVSSLNVLGENHFTALQHAFPTVSNFACDLFSTLGFSSLYFLGVDLGFTDIKHHHSKASGYYQEDGEEMFDYSEKNNTSLVVAGNFRSTVNTKHEFKVSRQIIEQVTAKKPRDQTFYNCSDGAKISNTVPLRVEEMLIVTTKAQKQQALKQIREHAFTATLSAGFVENFESKYSRTLLKSELEAFEQLLDEGFDKIADVECLINKQKEMLFSSYQQGKSLLFYYLYGTVNYANALLLKLTLSGKKDGDIPENLRTCIDYWKTAIATIKKRLISDIDDVDRSEYYRVKRENLLISNITKNRTILVVTDSAVFASSVKRIIHYLYKSLSCLTICSPSKMSSLEEPTFHYVIYFVSDSSSQKVLLEELKEQPALASLSNVFVTEHNVSDCKIFAQEIPTLTFLPTLFKVFEANPSISANAIYLSKIALQACIWNHRARLILPRYLAIDKPSNFKSSMPNGNSFKEFNGYQFNIYSTFYFKKDELKAIPLCLSGSRGEIINEFDQTSTLVVEQIDAAIFDELYNRYLSMSHDLFLGTPLDSLEITKLPEDPSNYQ